MAELLVGYCRCSTNEQDLTAQIDGLTRLGVDSQRIYIDHGLTGPNRDRPGLQEAMAAVREGDTLAVTKLDRLARSVPDARAIADELTARKVKLNIGGSVYDPTDPIGSLAAHRALDGRRGRGGPGPDAYLYATIGRERRGAATRLLRCLTDIPHYASDVS